MSDFGVEPDDMTRALMIDDKLNALLSGREAAPGDDLAGELSLTLELLRQAFPPGVVSEQVEDTHVTRIMEAAASLPVVEKASTVALEAPLLNRIRASLSRRVAVATLALSTAFGGAAYAGVLPKPIQQGVAELAAVVGLELPDGDHDTDLGRTLLDGEGDDGTHGPERGSDPSSSDGTVEEQSRDGDPERAGADSKDRDDSDPDSDEGEESRETDDHETDDHETDDHETDDHETDDHETDDSPEDDDEPDGGDDGEAEERESEDSEDPIDEIRDGDEAEGSSDPGLDSEEPDADPIQLDD